MSQHDLTIDDQGFPSFRSDLNLALKALGSTNSGTSAPSTTYANQLFYDTTNNILKIRNEDNDAFISLFTLDQTNDNIESLTVNGVLTVDSLVVDNITIDGTEIDLSSGDITLDAELDIKLDAAGGDIKFLSSGTEFGEIRNISSDLTIISSVADKDIVFKGQDSSSEIEAMRIDMSEGGKVGISNSAPPSLLTLGDGSSNITDYDLSASNSGQDAIFINSSDETSADGAKGNSIGFGAVDGHTNRHASICAVQTGSDRDQVGLAFHVHTSTSQTDAMVEACRIDNNGQLLIGKTQAGAEVEGVIFGASFGTFTRNSGIPMFINRQSDDGTLIEFRQANATEGSISVSGSAVSLNGGHLSRWSRLTNDTRDSSLVKGTVMTNLDEMIEWKHEKELWTKDDELPDGVSVGDVKKDAYTEDNEQLNFMAVSSVEGDANVAGVFVSWDNDDEVYKNDMIVGMTGDMVIRIAKGTKVARGDLLMSAGDGTAKPQGDDIVRSKTIAKVTSTNVSHTYDDGTYLVPCVLMAC